MIDVYVHQNGITTKAEKVEPAWLAPASTVTLWVDMVNPTPEETTLLNETFKLHPLSVEDARSALQFPKIETYPGYLYLVLHGIALKKGQTSFATRDIDFFLGRIYLITVHYGTSRSIARVKLVCDKPEREISVRAF